MSHLRPSFKVSFRSDDPVSVMLSNPAAAPFTLDHVACASVQGFCSHLLLPPGHPDRDRALTLSGKPAISVGHHTERKLAWWNGREMPFGSGAHEALLERAVRAKFEQNRAFMSALRSTDGFHLYQDLGKHPYGPRTILKPEVFCGFLMRLRDGQLPFWPRGTHEEPIEVIVQKRVYGDWYDAWIEDSHGHRYWRGSAESPHKAAYQTVELFIAVHDRVWFTFRQIPKAT